MCPIALIDDLSGDAPLFLTLFVDDGQSTQLSDKTGDLLAYLPTYYHADRSSLAVIDSVANELQRVEDYLTAFQSGYFPQNADDTYGILSLWEFILGLPVAPVGRTDDQRRSAVLATFRKRKSGKGSDWVDTVDTILGSQWSYEENVPGSYQVTVTTPTGSTTYTTAQAEALLREITPAHLDLVVLTGDTFVLDDSLLDDQAFG